MTFPLNLYGLAILSAFGVAVVSVPLWSKVCQWSGIIDDPGHRKIHHTPVPLAGGLAVFSALVIPLAGALIWFWLGPARQVQITNVLDPASIFALAYGMERRAIELAAICAGATGILVLGLLDDRYELSPVMKFGGQVLVSLLVAGAGVRVTLFVPNLIVSYTLTVIWIVTVVNAFNFMDNMNGLCTGLGAIGAYYFGIAAAIGGQYLVASLGFLVTGSLLGFLPHNFPRARAFLGDSGSHLVGFLLAVMAILPHFYSAENERWWAVLIPLFVLAVPLADLVWVICFRWRIGQPVYQGDNNHLSHRLVRFGFSRTTAVLLIWLTAAAVGWIWLII